MIASITLLVVVWHFRQRGKSKMTRVTLLALIFMAIAFVSSIAWLLGENAEPIASTASTIAAIILLIAELYDKDKD